MTVTGTADTAQLPRVVGVEEERLPAVIMVPAPPAPAPAPDANEPGPDRLALRAERQAARRGRRRWALLGLSIMAASLGATVAVLGAVH